MTFNPNDSLAWAGRFINKDKKHSQKRLISLAPMCKDWSGVFCPAPEARRMLRNV